LDNAARTRGRAYALTNMATSLAVANALNVVDYELLLVYDQPNASPGRLGAAGTSLAVSIDAFVHAGGAVVVLAGDSGEMGDFLGTAGLLHVSAQPTLTGEQL